VLGAAEAEAGAWAPFEANTSPRRQGFSFKFSRKFLPRMGDLLKDTKRAHRGQVPAVSLGCCELRKPLRLGGPLGVATSRAIQNCSSLYQGVLARDRHSSLQDSLLRIRIHVALFCVCVCVCVCVRERERENTCICPSTAHSQHPSPGHPQRGQGNFSPRGYRESL
jgi:hypothetical protein